MNEILCDNCKEQMKPVIEKKFLKDGIAINFFRCRKCNTKYLVDVTNKETREKQIEYTRLLKIQNNLVLSASKEKLSEDTKIMEALLKEIKEAKSILKEKYKDKL